METPRRLRRRWRDYRTATGARPVKKYIDALDDGDAQEVSAAMADVRKNGLKAARHLRGDIHEVRAEGPRDSHRILFAPEGRRNQILLSLHGIAKRGQKAPDHEIALAESRLADWRRRGKARGRER